MQYPKLVTFISDPTNKECILANNGVYLISQQLLHTNEEIALNALTTLIFLITDDSQASITSSEIITKVLHYKNHTNSRLKNLAMIFLDFCTEDQVKEATKHGLETVDIPLSN